MNDLVNIENRIDIKKDKISHAVLNVDATAYEDYLNILSARKIEKEQRDNRLESLESSISEIKQAINIIIERIK